MVMSTRVGIIISFLTSGPLPASTHLHSRHWHPGQVYMQVQVSLSLRSARMGEGM